MTDILVGSIQAITSSVGVTGVAYVLFGQRGFNTSTIDFSKPLTSQQGFRIFGANVGDQLGNAVVNAGDFNGDGVADILIGAHNAYHSFHSGAGMAYLIYGQRSGSSDIDTSLGLAYNQGFSIISSLSSEIFLGHIIVANIDLNNDGLSDVIILSNIGQYLIYGNNTYSASPSQSASRNTTSNKPTNKTTKPNTVTKPPPKASPSGSTTSSGDANSDLWSSDSDPTSETSHSQPSTEQKFKALEAKVVKLERTALSNLIIAVIALILLGLFVLFVVKLYRKIKMLENNNPSHIQLPATREPRIVRNGSAEAHLVLEDSSSVNDASVLPFKI